MPPAAPLVLRSFAVRLLSIQELSREKAQEFMDQSSDWTKSPGLPIAGYLHAESEGGKEPTKCMNIVLSS